MNRYKIVFLISFLFAGLLLYAQPVLQIANLGDLKTTSGKIIRDCNIGYRTAGKLNADRSNVILWPTWFAGTSEDISGLVYSLLDTGKYYVVMVDAFGNGVSSSPSNTPGFPSLSIRDMVNGQHLLLTRNLKFSHIRAVFGLSMGGMQALEWSVAYPDYMDKVVPVIGTPKQSSFDILVWQTAADLLSHGNNDPENQWMYKLAQNVVIIQEFTPEYVAKTVKNDSLKSYLNNHYAKKITAPDYLCQINAMIAHDIYTSAHIAPEQIKEVIKARLFMVVSARDHLVNPISSYQLSENLGAGLLKLDGECGHIAPLCEAETVKKAVGYFLDGNH